LSFGAFDGDKLVAFTFNGTGNFQNTPTAYDTGTGTIAEYRGRGLASEIFYHSIPFLKKAGIQNYLLEVLQHNDGAVKLYRKLGFKITREFFYYVRDIGSLDLNTPALDPMYSIETAGIPELDGAFDFSDILPSWQNNNASVSRAQEQLKARFVRASGSIVAYCIYEPASGDIASLAVSREHRRKHIGKQLLASAIRDITASKVKVINIPTEAEGITAFLGSCRMFPTGKQYEMIRVL
jgi:ribosomal protein S18 acetylase RimI-like enzyme